MEIRPIDKTRARQFINDHHRHNEAPSPMQVTFAIGIYEAEELVGVATAGRPVGRAHCDGFTLEVNRTCVQEYVKNANSKLYGAVCRAAKALGYRRVITYTLHDESGASLKASGFECVADIGVNTWSRPNRTRYDENLFGQRENASHRPKYRWERNLVTEKRLVA